MDVKCALYVVIVPFEGHRKIAIIDPVRVCEVTRGDKEHNKLFESYVGYSSLFEIEHIRTPPSIFSATGTMYKIKYVSDIGGHRDFTPLVRDFKTLIYWN